MCIKWGKLNFAHNINVLNCVRQGCVLSLKLFIIFVDDLSYELASCK